jgi:hypothetical protein
MIQWLDQFKAIHSMARIFSQSKKGQDIRCRGAMGSSGAEIIFLDKGSFSLTMDLGEKRRAFRE